MHKVIGKNWISEFCVILVLQMAHKMTRALLLQTYIPLFVQPMVLSSLPQWIAQEAELWLDINREWEISGENAMNRWDLRGWIQNHLHRPAPHEFYRKPAVSLADETSLLSITLWVNSTRALLLPLCGPYKQLSEIMRGPRTENYSFFALECR